MPATKAPSRLSVTDRNIRNAAARLIAQGSLVSAEVAWVRNALGSTATQEQIDEQVLAVRKLPWSAVMSGA